MVFFTCNACGASLKKNQVEKHYQNECPSCEVLSCIDCGRDFYGDEYAAHTKCISEAEKYQGALYKESGKGGKGERKQLEWLEKVKQSVSGAKVTPRVAGLLERISDYPNIPRKRSKFENFIRNSFNVRDQNTLTQLWDAFSGASKKSQDEPKATERKGVEVLCLKNQDSEGSANIDDFETNNTPKKKKKEKEMDSVEATGSTEEIDAQKDSAERNDDKTESILKKKQKKTKKKVEVELSTVGCDDGERCSEGEEDERPKKKKKKKKNKALESSSDCVDSLSPVDASVDAEGVTVTKKAKKKRHREKENNVNYKEELMTSMLRDSVDDLNDMTAPQKKKQKLKSVDNEGCELMNEVSLPMEKKRRKKHKKRLLTSEV